MSIFSDKEGQSNIKDVAQSLIEIDKINEIEQIIIELGKNKKLKDLKDFPISTFNKVNSSFRDGSLKLEADFDSVNTWITVALKKEKILIKNLNNLPYIILLLNIALAIILQNWFYMFGILSALL